MSDDAEAETVTRLLDEVGRDYVVRILITARLIAKHDEADNWRRLTQRTDGILMSHALKTLTANLNITAHFYHSPTAYHYYFQSFIRYGHAVRILWSVAWREQYCHQLRECKKSLTIFNNNGSVKCPPQYADENCLECPGSTSHTPSS